MAVLKVIVIDEYKKPTQVFGMIRQRIISPTQWTNFISLHRSGDLNFISNGLDDDDESLKRAENYYFFRVLSILLSFYPCTAATAASSGGEMDDMATESTAQHSVACTHSVKV